MLSLRRRGEKEAYDQRILGDGDFVDMILSESEGVLKENLRLVSERRMDLTALSERVCRVHGVSIVEIRAGSRRKDVAEARRILSLLTVKELGYSGAEVARYLGVTNSCITRHVSIGKLPPKKKYI